MKQVVQCETFSGRFERLNDLGKQYIEAIIQTLEFAQESAPDTLPSLPVSSHLADGRPDHRSA